MAIITLTKQTQPIDRPGQPCAIAPLDQDGAFVSSQMRSAGAEVLLDCDVAYSAYEKAEAVYIAMETAKKSGNPCPIPVQIKVGKGLTDC